MLLDWIGVLIDEITYQKAAEAVEIPPLQVQFMVHSSSTTLFHHQMKVPLCTESTMEKSPHGEVLDQKMKKAGLDAMIDVR